MIDNALLMSLLADFGGDTSAPPLAFVYHPGNGLIVVACDGRKYRIKQVFVDMKLRDMGDRIKGKQTATTQAAETQPAAVESAPVNVWHAPGSGLVKINKASQQPLPFGKQVRQ